MKVKDILISALEIIGRSELAKSLAGGEELSAGDSETVNTLLYCFNATEDELARKYMPLSYKEEITSQNGRFYFAAFVHAPVKLKSVTSDGESVSYEIFPEYLKADARKITVEYDYSPSKKELGGTSDFGAEAGEHLLALGAAAEYCLINGEAEAAELWEKKYRAAIDGAQSKLPAGFSIPPRRWI